MRQTSALHKLQQIAFHKWILVPGSNAYLLVLADVKQLLWSLAAAVELLQLLRSSGTARGCTSWQLVACGKNAAECVFHKGILVRGSKTPAC
jgi:hypothetical protein